MILYKLARFKIVFIEMVIERMWTAWNKLWLSGYCKFGKGVKFRGRVFVESCGGNVIFGDYVKIGKNVQISAMTGAQIILGNNVTINAGSVIVARESIKIFNNVMVGEYCSIRDNDHEWRNKDVAIRSQGYVIKSVEVREDVWLGRGVTIGKGVVVGQGSVVGASSVVTSNIDSFSVAVGVPAKTIKYR